MVELNSEEERELEWLMTIEPDEFRQKVEERIESGEEGLYDSLDRKGMLATSQEVSSIPGVLGSFAYYSSLSLEGRTYLPDKKAREASDERMRKLDRRSAYIAAIVAAIITIAGNIVIELIRLYS